MSESTWFTLENLKKIKKTRTRGDTIKTLEKLKKAKKINNIILVTEEMMGRDTVNKCR